MKKKIFMISVIALLCISVLATWAFLTAEETTTNEISTGAVDMELYELGEGEPYTEGDTKGMIFRDVMPGAELHKEKCRNDNSGTNQAKIPHVPEPELNGGSEIFGVVVGFHKSSFPLTHRTSHHRSGSHSRIHRTRHAHHIHMHTRIQPELLGNPRHFVRRKHHADGKNHVRLPRQKSQKQEGCLQK
jgi:predicted ribosomally synthesized peptide with SipW-like signal peptide